MRTIGRGIALGAALLGFATGGQAQETEILVARTVGAPAGPTLLVVPSDTLPPATQAELRPGMLMRVRLEVSPYGIPRPHDLTARYMDQEPGALLFETDAPYPNRFRRVGIDEMLRLEIGTERTLAARGAWIGALSGVALGAIVLATGDGQGGWFDGADGAEYLAGTAIFGVTGAATGAWLTDAFGASSSDPATSALSLVPDVPKLSIPSARLYRRCSSCSHVKPMPPSTWIAVSHTATALSAA